MAGNTRGVLAIVAAVTILAVAAGIIVGYAVWGPRDWYVFRDPARLPPGEANDLIRYGRQIVVNTPSVIGKEAADPAMRYSGNGLACTNCHLNAGLQAFAAPYVSTFASFPMMVNDTVETLADRINGCMTNSLNGKPLPENSREMDAIIAYIQFLGVGTPEGVRVPGMGLKPLPPAAETPDAARGETVFADVCAKCHGRHGFGNYRTPPGVGYAIPPLVGDDSFNEAAGMATIEMAAAFIHANMPRGVTYTAPVLTVQQAWDVAAWVTTQKRPPAPMAPPVPAAAPTANSAPEPQPPASP